VTDDELETIALKLRALPAVETVETYEVDGAALVAARRRRDREPRASR
jgi:hypothetical protein